jgi:hypothetical protein
MRDRNLGEEARERSSEGARGVALHDEQVGLWTQLPEHGVRNGLDVSVRIRFAWAAEAHRRIRLKPEFGGTESGVLIGEHERRRQTAIAERMGDGRQLDGFRSGADDQPYIGETQSPP